MSTYRKVDTRIWNDQKFRELSDKAKLGFFLLLTHPHMTSLGAMRATPGGLADELGWTPEAFREAFREALAKGIAKHDSKACCIWLPNFLKYNGPESPNVVKSWGKALDLIPECDLKNQCVQRVKDFIEGLSEGFREALPEAFRKTMPNQEQEQEQEQDSIPEGKSGSGSGSKKKPTKPKSAKSTSVFDWINNEDLHEIGKLIAWHKRASNCPNPVVGKTEADRLNVVAAAVRAWEKGDDPVRLFGWIVGKQRWDFIKQEHEDTAHRLIKQYLTGVDPLAERRGGTSTSAELVADLFSGLGVNP